MDVALWRESGRNKCLIHLIDLVQQCGGEIAQHIHRWGEGSYAAFLRGPIWIVLVRVVWLFPGWVGPLSYCLDSSNSWKSVQPGLMKKSCFIQFFDRLHNWLLVCKGNWYVGRRSGVEHVVLTSDSSQVQVSLSSCLYVIPPHLLVDSFIWIQKRKIVFIIYPVFFCFLFARINTQTQH